MDGLSKWMFDLSWPLVSRVLASLGMGTLTFTGVDLALTGFLDNAKSMFSGVSGDVLQIVALSGFFDAMSITSGGIISGMAFMQMKRFALRSTGA